MKSWHIILLFLLTAAFYLISSSSSSSSISLAGRRSLKMSLPHHKNRYPKAKAKVVDEGWQSSGKGSMGLGYSRGNDNTMDDDDDNEVVNYHIDYHGVTTHPTPTPKHPKP